MSQNKKVSKICEDCGDEFFISTKKTLIYRASRKYCYPKCSKKYMNLSGLKLGRGWNKGIPHTEEQKEKFRKAKLKNPTRYWLGKVREDMRGKNNWTWKGGTGTERHQAMGRIEYKLWRRAVFERDDYICQICGERGGKLEADHIKPWSLYPELRYAIDNGRTLCVDCHRQTDTWGVKVYGSK